MKSLKQNNNSTSARWQVIRELKPEIPATYPDLMEAFRIDSMKKAGLLQDLQTVVVRYTNNVAADASGNVQVNLSNDPNNSPYWNSTGVMAATFDQYRVLGMRLSFTPYNLVGGSSLSTRTPIVCVTDYDDATSLTSYALAESFSDCKEHRPDAPFTKVAIEPTTSGSGGWNNSINVAPTDGVWIKLYSSGNTASINIGRITMEYVVQLKGRGI